MAEQPTAREWPTYQCHKLVKALRIESVKSLEGGDALELHFGDGFPPERITRDVFSRYLPVPGDYIVRYEDGYLSLSPQVAFETGYSKMHHSHDHRTGSPPPGMHPL